MKILKLTRTTERKLLARRQRRDASAERVAARIVADVRRGGDVALWRWSRKLDSLDLSATGLWVSAREMAGAKVKVSREFLKAARHAIRNVERVA